MFEVPAAASALASGRGPAVRWCLMGVGLVAEGIALTVSFDSPAASAGDYWWVWLEAAAPDLMRILAAFFGAFVLVLAPRLGDTLAYARRWAIGHRWQPWLLLHCLGFAGLVTFLARSGLGSGASGVEGPSGAWALCCGIGLAAAVAAFWFLAMAPAEYWRRFFARERITFLAAFGAAAVAWAGGEIAHTFWWTLGSATFVAGDWMLRLVYADVVIEPSQFLLGTHGFRVQIAPQCSGYEGIALVVTFLAIYLWLFRARIRFPQAFVLFPIAITAVWLVNVLRIVGLIVIGTSFSRQLSAGAFHSQAGWIGFIAVALAVVAVTHRMRFFEMRQAKAPRHEINPTAKALLVPFLVLVGSLMVSTALSDGFDQFYPARVVAVTVALLAFFRTYRSWDWCWSWFSVGIGAAVFLVWLALDGTAGANATIGAAIAGLGDGERAIWLGFRVAGSVLVVPLVEEMAFRGYLLRRLTAVEFEGMPAKRFNWMAFALSSIAFGLLHGRWTAGTAAGMAFALAQYRRGELGDAVVAHMTANGLIALLVLMTGAWALWS
jgi:exosortase E/protease (VPEID-CTERM system)